MDEKGDIGFVEDAITSLCELLHIEVHSRKSFMETGNKEWLEINNEARKDRTELLDKIILHQDGECWCFSKHCLTNVLSNMELANRKYAIGEIEEAKKYFEKSSKWLGIFLIKNKIEVNKNVSAIK